VKLRTALLPGIAVVALAAPGLSQAATLTADRSCYGPGQTIVLTGAGFTPSGLVALSTEGQQLGTGPADAAGGFRVGLPAPVVSAKKRTDDFLATDQTDLALTATAPVLISSLDVLVKPAKSPPAKKRRINARGFTTGKTLWAHVRRGKKRRNVKIGKLKKPCGTLSVKKRLFAPDAPVGVYQVQFDSKRTYSSSTRPSVSYVVEVFKTFKLASLSTASVGESWVRTR
jgi:hypothetical protein